VTLKKPALPDFFLLFFPFITELRIYACTANTGSIAAQASEKAALGLFSPSRLTFKL
jgi:hypothetical protein